MANTLAWDIFGSVRVGLEDKTAVFLAFRIVSVLVRGPEGTDFRCGDGVVM